MAVTSTQRVKTMTRKAPVVRFLIATGALVLSSGAMAGQPLFLGQATAPSPATEATAAKLANKPTTFGMRVMRANPNVVDKANHEIELDLGMRRVNLVLDKASDTSTGSLVWAGHVLETSKARSMSVRETRTDDANSGILVRRGNGITGSVRVNGQLYRIRPLPDGSHAVIEVNESRMPPEHPAGYNDNDLPSFNMDRASMSAQGGVSAMAIDPGATATIRVQVVATNQAVTAYGGDMQALAELAVAETNQGYANSNVGINMQLANYTTVAYTSAGDGHFTDKDRFVGKTDGYMDGIHATRDANAADVNVLIIDDAGNCGLAAAIGANAATSFATVHWDCATGYYSFGHEIGHLLSARHDPAADPTNTPYAYGHGYRAPGNAWRTIMAYNCTVSCPRLNYWSNPDVTYGGVPMGTAASNHNQRVLVATKATMAAFRGTTPPPRTTYTNGTDYTISDNATVDSPITVAGRSGNAPSDTAVVVNILHTYKGDLKVDLVAPDGSLYNIHNRTGSSTDNVTGTFVKNLSTEAINGTWKLRVNDNASGDVGRIDSWSITF
jgi:hypothetical protein